MIISLGIILRIKNVSDKFCREIKSKIPCSIYIFFFSKNHHAIYEIILKKIWHDQTGYMWQYEVAQERFKQLDTHNIQYLLLYD